MKKSLEFGQQLKTLRETQGLKQDQMAARLGVDKSLVCLHEKGKRSVSPLGYLRSSVPGTLTAKRNHPMGDFTYVKLNPEGAKRVAQIELGFTSLMTALTEACPKGRELALVRTKLQEATFWAKKAVCELPESQES